MRNWERSFGPMATPPPLTFGQLGAAAAEVMLAPSLLSPEEQRIVQELQERVAQQKPVTPYVAQQLLGILHRLRKQTPALLEDLILAEKLFTPEEFQALNGVKAKLDAKQGATVGDVHNVLRAFQKVRVMMSTAMSQLEQLKQNMPAVLATEDQDKLLIIATKLEFGTPLSAVDVADIHRIYTDFRNGFGGYVF